MVNVALLIWIINFNTGLKKEFYANLANILKTQTYSEHRIIKMLWNSVTIHPTLSWFCSMLVDDFNIFISKKTTVWNTTGNGATAERGEWHIGYVLETRRIQFECSEHKKCKKLSQCCVNMCVSSFAVLWPTKMKSKPFCPKFRYCMIKWLIAIFFGFTAWQWTELQPQTNKLCWWSKQFFFTAHINTCIFGLCEFDLFQSFRMTSHISLDLDKSAELIILLTTR